MPKFQEITVQFQGNCTVKFTNKTFKEVIQKCFEPTFLDRTPLLFTFATGKKLYFHKELLNSWLHAEITMQELVTATETEGLFRNKKEINEIDPGALWYQQRNECILADVDQDLRVSFSADLFDELEFIKD